MKKYSDISKRYIKANKRKSIIIITGITLAVLSIFSLLTFLISYKESLIASERSKNNYEFIINNLNKDQADNILKDKEVKDTSRIKEEILVEDNYVVSIYVNLSSEKDKQNVIKSLLKKNNIELNDSTKIDNSKLLYLTGNGEDKDINLTIRNVLIAFIIIIIIVSIALIYNSFNIELIERMKHFATLKTIGASNIQIKRIILKEALIMWIIAFFIGISTSIVFLKYGVRFLEFKILKDLEVFKLKFSLEVFIITIVITLTSVIIGSLVPAKRIKKISIVEASKNQNSIKINRIKFGLLDKLLGIERSIAYKNIKRTKGKFIITTSALTLSIIVFNVFYGASTLSRESVMLQFNYGDFHGELSKNDNSEFSNEEIAKIEQDLNVENISRYYYSNVISAVPLDKINENFKKEYGHSLGSSKYENKGYQDISIETYVGDFKDFKKSFDEDGIILIDGVNTYDSEGNKIKVRATKYEVGDIIKAAKVKDDNEESLDSAINNNDFLEVKIIDILDKDPYTGTSSGNNIKIIYPKKLYETNFGEIKYNSLAINYKETENDSEKIVDYFKKEANYSYSDRLYLQKSIKENYNQISLFVYTFILIIVLVACLNIFNTIYTNILLRKKELSVLKAIGMTKSQLRKSIRFEGTIYGIVSSIIGGSISVIVLVFLSKQYELITGTKQNLNIEVLIISLIVTLLITYIASLIPLRKIEKMTIVEAIEKVE